MNTPAPSRMVAWSATAVIALFCAVLCTGLFIPAHIDNICYLIMDSRAGYDGWQSITLYPQCGSSFITDIPISLLPGEAWAWVAQLVINDFFTIRLISIAILLAWIAYTAWFLKQCILPAQPVLYILAGILGFIELGALPFAMLQGRPETAMIFAATFFASLPFFVRKYPTPPRWVILSVTLLFLLVTSWFLSVHFKALLYAPLLLVSAGYTGKWHKSLGRVLVCVTVFACWQAWNYHLSRIACPDSLAVSQAWKGVAIFPSLFFSDNFQFWRQLIVNILNNGSYIWKITLLQSEWWRPDFTPATSSSYGIALLYTALWLAAALFIAVVMLRALIWTVANTFIATSDAFSNDTWKRPELLVPLCLLTAFVAQSATRTYKVFYDFSLIWITLILSGVIVTTYFSKYTAYWSTRASGLKRDYTILLITAMVSQCALLLSCYVTPGLSTAGEPATNGEIQNRGGYISEVNYEETKQHILGAARMCHIATDQSSRHVMIDQYTYLLLKTTYQPLFLGTLGEPQELFAFLRGWQSSGLVALCDSLPKRIRPFAKENEGVCCLSREQINAL